MALSRVKVWVAGETLTASDLNAEFQNILDNAASLISPLGGALDWDGYAHTLDAAGVTTAQSTAAIGWAFTPGNKTGTPSTTGGITNYAASTWTDSNTAGSGTATAWVGHAFQRPTLAATNSSVTTTDAATVYIPNAPLAGSNQTLTNPWTLWIDAGNVRFDDDIYWLSGTAFNGILAHNNAAARTYTFPDATGNIPTVAAQADVDAATSTVTALSPNLNRLSLKTAQATTSGTEFDFTSIPAGTRRISVHFFGVSLSGTDDILVQLGDAGGIENTGYVSTSAAMASGGNSISTSTAGFIINMGSAAFVLSGILHVELSTAASFLWVAKMDGKVATTQAVMAGGEKALSAELTQVRITRTGTNTFDAGSVNVMFER